MCLFRSRGFGFITFKEMEMLDEAQKSRPHRIDEKDVEVKRAMPREVSCLPLCFFVSCGALCNSQSGPQLVVRSCTRS